MSEHPVADDANHFVQAHHEALTAVIEAGRLHRNSLEVLLANATCLHCTARALTWISVYLASSEAQVHDAAQDSLIDILNNHITLPEPTAHRDTMYTADILARHTVEDVTDDESEGA